MTINISSVAVDQVILPTFQDGPEKQQASLVVML
jgi:hypothetical protein